MTTPSKYAGGLFLDGRRDTLAGQAKDPFLNPKEMHNTDKADVVSKVKLASYADEFREVFGQNAFDDTNAAYDNIAKAIAAFESTRMFSPFSSKFDAVMAGKATFTASEQRGFDLFKSDKAKCANCHTIKNPPDQSLFTDFKYFNIGTPRNPHNPDTAVDIGLAGNPNIDSADAATEKGKFRTPTLRNVAITAPYMHNGAYATLQEVIQHYDISVANYIQEPAFSFNYEPEVKENIAEEMKTTLGLDTATDYVDLENFLKTLTDGFM